MIVWLCADSASVISVARSFGLSTTTGARGDAVSYVLRVDGLATTTSATAANSDASSPQTSSAAAATPAAVATAATASLLGVVKVIKSRNVLQQELCALQLIRSLMPAPRHAFYPRLLAAEWALIPTAIPTAAGTTSSASAFARPYSVSSMGSSSIGSTSSSFTADAAASYCQGGLVLMECAPGVPLSELFSRVGHEAAGSEGRISRVAELAVAIREAARALAELHMATAVPSASAEAVRPFIQDMAAQVRDMLAKLALPEYAASINKWNLELPAIAKQLERIMQQTFDEPGGQQRVARTHPSVQRIDRLLRFSFLISLSCFLCPVCCLIHGDAHAGNMLWDSSQQRITLIDLPTMLQATKVESVASEACEAKIPQGKFKLAADNTTTTTTTTPPTAPAAASVLPRHSAVCLPPPSFLLSGCALAARDVCHFERKLDSHGSRRGMSEREVSDAQGEFWTAYSAAGGLISQPARRFFRLRSLMGEITQLIKYEPDGMTQTMREQLQQIITTDGSGGDLKQIGQPESCCRTSS